MAEDNLAKVAEDLAASMGAAGTGVPPEPPPPGGMAGAPGAPGGSSKSEKEARNLDLILDIPLRVTVELGRARMVVSELLNLSQGSVIELSKLAGEPLEVLVNDKLVARGEAVVVNEKFGVRLTDIISPTERVNQLK
jgi:flagellar motor switch protein FliN/FliY